jgi:hypothetical protein
MLVQSLKPYSDEYWRAEQLAGTSIIHVQRSAVPFPAPRIVEHALLALNRHLDTVDRSRHGVLVDIRNVAGRNDPEFENAFEPGRVRLQRGFHRVAVLVNSIAGQLQVQRHAIDDRSAVRPFLDRAEAIAWLTR